MQFPHNSFKQALLNTKASPVDISEPAECGIKYKYLGTAHLQCYINQSESTLRL